MATSHLSATSYPQLTADDISCDQAELVSSKLDIFELRASTQCAVDVPAKSSISELPPPHRFRRQQLGKKGFKLNVDLKIQSQMQDYLVSYREVTGRLLTEASSAARPMKQAEVDEIARQIFFRP